MATAIDTIRGSGARFIVFPWGTEPSHTQAYVADRVGRGVSGLYNQHEAADLALWLNQRDAGYPALARFAGGAEWPVGDVSPVGLDCNGERVGLDKFAPCCRKPPKRAPRRV